MSAIKVFERELVEAARRPGYYRMRVAAIVAVIFVILGLKDAFPGMSVFTKILYDGEVSAGFSRNVVVGSINALCLTLIGVQFFVVVNLTPALMAGVIVEEKQQKTLPELLMTLLEPWEILWAKLWAQMMQVAVLAGMTLPGIVFLASLGDLPVPWLIGLEILVFSTAYLMGGMGIFASTMARRLSEAIMGSYVLTVSVLVLPVLILDVVLIRAGMEWRQWHDQLWWLTSAVSHASPISLWADWWYLQPLGETAIFRRVVKIVILQCAYGTLFLLLASVLLRRVQARQMGREQGGGGVTWLTRPGRVRRLFPRPACGDRPIYWKERYLAKSTTVSRMMMAGGFALMIGWLVFLVSASFWDAWNRVWLLGYWWSPFMGSGIAPTDLVHVRGVNAIMGISRFLCLTWFVVVAMNMVDSWIRERLQDTWVSLLTTPMSGRELLREKMSGAVMRIWPLAAVIAIFWYFAVMVGFLHPAAFVAMVFALATVTWSILVICTYISVGARARLRQTAIGAAFFMLFSLVGQWNEWVKLLVSPDQFVTFGGYLGQSFNPLRGTPEVSWEFARNWTAFFAIHFTIMMILTRILAGEFDEIVGRPIRTLRLRGKPQSGGSLPKNEGLPSPAAWENTRSYVPADKNV